MRDFRRAVALLWPLLTSAFALPALPASQSSDDSRHISTVFGSTSGRQVSVRFETPCQGCFIGTDDGLVFDLTVAKATTECGIVLPLVNGVPLGGSWKQNHGKGHGTLQTKLVNGLGEREVYASWETLCIPDEAQILSFTVHNIGQDKVKEASGFTASFKQRGQPEILRLDGEPADLEPQDISLLDPWVAPPASLRLSVLAPEPDRNIDQILADQFGQLAKLEADARQLEGAVHDKKNQIKHIIQQDFRSTIDSCPGIKCVLQTTFWEVPKIIQLIADRFHRGRPSSSRIYQSAANESRSLDQDNEDSTVDLFNVPQPPSPSHDELDWPPPPHGDMLPPSPHGHMPPPPPPGSAPPHLPPPGWGPPPPPGSAPPPDHGHHPPPLPHFPPHRHHHRHGPKLLKRIIFVIVLSTLASLLFRHLRHNSTLFRCRHRSADRACRHEERRNRRAARRAALQHHWSTWWNRYRRPSNTADYDEKRTLILEQEGVLEDAMQDELRVLRSAHQIVEQMYDAEEGRSRLYRAANRPGAVLAAPAELDAAGSSRRGRRNSTSLSLSSLPPPPRYDEELEGDLTVVNGFQYTPRSSSVDDDTPDSSVVDCSPRMSCDTGRTMITRGEDRD